MNEVQRTYLRVIGLIALDKKELRQAALERAHDIRKFEIGLYWQRANYFWLFQAAVFAAIGFTWKLDSTSFPKILPIGLASLGSITAWAGLLSSHSSKFWQRNWEYHIDMLETEFEGNLYKTVYVGLPGTKWSPTGLNERLAAVFFVFWILILAKMTLYFNNNWNFNPCDLSMHIQSLEFETGVVWLFTIFALSWLYAKGGFQYESSVIEVIALAEDCEGDRTWIRPPSFRSKANEVPFLIKRGTQR